MLIYLNLRHRGTDTIWKVWVFWGITIFSPLISSLESKYDLINGISVFLKMAIQFLFFIYFFALDTVHIDSLKLLLYDDLTIDETTGRVFRNPRSKISSKKLKQLGISTGLLIMGSLLLIVIVTKFIEFFERARPGSTVPGGPTPSTPKTKNQQQLEDIFRTNPIAVIFSAVFIAPVLEEWVYRRFLMKAGQFQWWTILLSGFLFGLIHLKDKEGLITLVPYMLPGIVFASGMYISKNIWHSIIAHSLYNTLSIIKMLLVNEN